MIGYFYAANILIRWLLTVLENVFYDLLMNS
jgi:hypothetical protein